MSGIFISSGGSRPQQQVNQPSETYTPTPSTRPSDSFDPDIMEALLEALLQDDMDDGSFLVISENEENALRSEFGDAAIDQIDLNDVFAQSLEEPVPITESNSSTAPSNPFDPIEGVNDDTLQQILDLLDNSDLSGEENADLRDALNDFVALLDQLSDLSATGPMTDADREAIEDQVKEATLALQHHYVILLEQFNQYTLDRATQEQIRNLLFNMTLNQTQNLFQLAKTVVNVAKY